MKLKEDCWQHKRNEEAGSRNAEARMKNENLKERIEKFLVSDFRMKSLQNLVLTILPLNSQK